jgi:hypothetical protein
VSNVIVCSLLNDFPLPDLSVLPAALFHRDGDVEAEVGVLLKGFNCAAELLVLGYRQERVVVGGSYELLKGRGWVDNCLRRSKL